MRVPELADVLRGAGLTVTEIPGWTTYDHGPLSGVRTIVCHHTAGPSTGDFPSLSVVRNGRPGLAGPLAQLGLGRSGHWWTISAGKAWHAGVVLQTDYSNDFSIGIEAEATGRDSWPEAQLESYARGCRALIDHFGLSVSRVLGHKEVCSPPGRKIDPNFDMVAFRARIAAIQGGTDMPLTTSDIDLLLREPLQRHVNEAKVNVPDALTVGEALGLLYIRAAAGTDGGAPVDLDLLASKVADVLAARLAQ